MSVTIWSWYLLNRAQFPRHSWGTWPFLDLKSLIFIGASKWVCPKAWACRDTPKLAFYSEKKNSLVPYCWNPQSTINNSLTLEQQNCGFDFHTNLKICLPKTYVQIHTCGYTIHPRSIYSSDFHTRVVQRHLHTTQVPCRGWQKRPGQDTGAKHIKKQQ